MPNNNNNNTKDFARVQLRGFFSQKGGGKELKKRGNGSIKLEIDPKRKKKYLKCTLGQETVQFDPARHLCASHCVVYINPVAILDMHEKFS